jgi:dihydrofolate reductase
MAENRVIGSGNALPWRLPRDMKRFKELTMGHTVVMGDEALNLAGDDDEVFVAGGAQIYRLALPRADRIYLTVVHAEVPGDTVFPPFDESAWQLRADEHCDSDERHAHAFSFRTYDRR